MALRIFFFFFAEPHGLQDLSSATRDWSHSECTKSWPLDHQGIPCEYFKNLFVLKKKSTTVDFFKVNNKIKVTTQAT